MCSIRANRNRPLEIWQRECRYSIAAVFRAYYVVQRLIVRDLKQTAIGSGPASRNETAGEIGNLSEERRTTGARCVGGYRDQRRKLQRRLPVVEGLATSRWNLRGRERYRSLPGRCSDLASWSPDDCGSHQVRNCEVRRGIAAVVHAQNRKQRRVLINRNS